MFRTLMAAAGAAALAVIGVAVAQGEPLIAFGHADRAADAGRQDRLLAKAAFTQVLAHRADVLGMTPPLNAPPYAPVYPDGLILQEAMSAQSPTGGSLSYAAPASLRTVMDFYEDAAALARMPFHVAAVAPDAVLLTATDGRRTLKARLTRQFEQGTVVDLSYD
jgi:hypothetical protein